MSDNPTYCSTDLSAPGRNLGYIRMPHSVHRSAYGQIPVPVASCVGDRDGPSVLLMAGNHGDEYEGQIILSELIQTLDPADVRGRITMLPMANFPAAQAGLRTSPLDDGNLNRSFPGQPRGTPTAMMADYIETELMPGVDLLIDLHSGGSSLYCVPFALTPWVDGNDRNDMRMQVLDALGLGYALLYPPDGDGWFSSSAAWRVGAAGFTLELGGGGTVDPVIRIKAQAGLMRALAAVGSYTGPTTADSLADHRVDFYSEDLILADEPGLYEPLVKAGEQAVKGSPVARIHFPETPGKPCLTVTIDRDATVLAHRVPARVVRGDCLFHVGW